VADDSVPGAATSASSSNIGRVRLADETAAAQTPDGSAPGWSAIGALVAIVVVALMAAALVFLLWVALRTTPT
jgi:anti-sigma-K factor RskA